MKKRSILFMIFILASVVMMANDGNGKESSKALTTTLTGKVIDKNSGEYLAGVAVKLQGSDKVVYTDFDGNFEFANLKPGDYKVTANMISYKDNTENVKLNLKNESRVELQLETLSNK